MEWNMDQISGRQAFIHEKVFLQFMGMLQKKTANESIK